MLQTDDSPWAGRTCCASVRPFSNFAASPLRNAFGVEVVLWFFSQGGRCATTTREFRTAVLFVCAATTQELRTAVPFVPDTFSWASRAKCRAARSPLRGSRSPGRVSARGNLAEFLQAAAAHVLQVVTHLVAGERIAALQLFRSVELLQGRFVFARCIESKP